MILLCLVMLVVGLWWLPWVQTAPGSGTLIALDPQGRVQSVTALVSGRIKAWHVQDGSRVKKGDLLVEIVDMDPRFLQRLEAERAAVNAKFDAARAATETALLDVERKTRLFEKGLAARRDREAANIRYKELLAAQSSAAAEVAKAETQVARQTTQRVLAPQDGVVVRSAALDTATLVREGDELLSFAPSASKRAVEIYVNGLDAALVQPGRRARLMFEGWPAVQFSGWPSVAVGTFPAMVHFVDPAISANGRFRVVLVEEPGAPWPDERFLRLGGKAKGWVLLNEVRLGYELWRQLNSFPPEATAAAGPSP
ncbi:MAG: HlyD family efflux transporter periplasmic adaptor subunit [Gammaproteobacteria bacterium]|nr:HlyD family efflux transporter periplasmic adaptor subunit [Gammaproteobacteria bacterium]